jgi:hypothetical protein
MSELAKRIRAAQKHFEHLPVPVYCSYLKSARFEFVNSALAAGV